MLEKKLLFFILIFFTYNAKSQDVNFMGTPDISSYTRDDYTASPQNWSIAQDSLGRMFFGNNFGLLKFNGFSWELYPTEKQSILRSICIFSNKKIAVGGQGELGYFYVDSSRLKFKNLLNNYHDEHNFINVWKTFKQNDTVFYFLDRNDIVYAVNDSINRVIIPSNFKKFRGFQIHNQIYIVDQKEGLAVLRGIKIIPLNQMKAIAKYKVYSLLKSPNGKLIAITATNGIYERENSFRWEKINTGYDKYLKDNYPYSAIYLRDSNLLVTTLLGGLVFLDKDIKIRKILNSDNGLNADGVYCAFQDNEDDIWLATENGISFINYSSPLHIFTKKNGLKGSIKAIKTFKNTLYIGTYGGLYLFDESENLLNPDKKSISLLSKKYYFISDFQVFQSPYSRKKSLFATGLRNIIEIKNRRVISKDELYGSEKILQIPEHKKYFVVSQNKGITVYKIINDRFSIKRIGRLYAFNYESKNMAYDNKGNLWVETPRNGVALVHITDYANLDYESKIFDEKNGLPNKYFNRPFFIDNQLIIATNRGLYGLKDSTAKINKYKFKSLNIWGLNFKKDSLFIDKIFSIGNQKWFVSNKGFFYQKNGKNIFEPFLPLKPVKTESDIFSDSQNFVWIASHTGLYAFDNTQKINNKIKTFPLIYNIILGGDKIKHLGFIKSRKDSCCLSYNIGKLNFNENTVALEFSIPYFRYINKIKYSYYLKGYDKRWSAFEKRNSVRYTNLPSGKYAFNVKAINIYKNQSKTSILYFEIARPWYYSIFAYILYLVFFILFIIGLIKMNARRLVNRNLILEKLVKKRTSEINNQKEEISVQSEKLKSQAEMLELSNNELKQLSLVAKNTSNSVVILDEKGDIEWWNTGFTQLFKAKFRRFQGSNFNKIKNRIRPDFVKSLKQIKETHKSIVYTIKDDLDEKTTIWYQTNITPVYNDDGSIFRYVVVDSDITQIKEAEREIYAQKSKLEKQRDKISFQNKEITSSIEYASRIQEAMLPLGIFLEAVLFNHYFVLNLPRDIVSGDFYWVNVHRNKTYIAVGDCTGHGIPGAFLSLLGISYLNNIIQRTQDRDIMPNEVLNRLREYFISTLHQRGKSGENQDGMDIALIVLDYEKMEMHFAGANNSIYYFENKDDVVHEIMADKMPIGIHINIETPFNLSTRKFSRGETVYLFSDGYRDQFGGEQGKKFMTKRFKKILRNIHKKPMDIQKQILNEILQEWKSGYDQVDDILVFGLKT